MKVEAVAALFPIGELVERGLVQRGERVVGVRRNRPVKEALGIVEFHQEIGMDQPAHREGERGFPDRGPGP